MGGDGGGPAGVYRTSRPPKKSLGAKPVLKRGVAKWPPKCKVGHSSLSALTCSDFNDVWHACVACQYAQIIFVVCPYSKRAWQNGRQMSGPYGLQKK